MADFYSSANVSVFPSVFRTYNPSGKFTNETNFAGIVKSVVDRDSYVLSYENNELRVVIYGYYFLIRDLRSLPKFAAIKVAADTMERCFNLVNFNDSSTTLDDSNRFYGIAFSNESISTDDNTKVLQLVKDDGTINYDRISAAAVYIPNSQGNPEKNLITVLENKQDKLYVKVDSNNVPTEGLQMYTENDKEYIRIWDPHLQKLKHLTDMGTVNANTRPYKLHFFDASGILQLSNGNAGYAYASTGSSMGSQYAPTSRAIYLANGIITPGPRTFFSTSAPPTTYSSGEFNNGEIWIRYSNN